MKRTIFSILMGVIFLAGTFCAFAEAEEPSQVLAKVNDEEILQSDVDNIITTFVLPQFQAQNPGQEIPAERRLLPNRSPYGRRHFLERGLF